MTGPLTKNSAFLQGEADVFEWSSALNYQAGFTEKLCRFQDASSVSEQMLDQYQSWAHLQVSRCNMNFAKGKLQASSKF